MQKAVIDDDNTVQNLIVADNSYSHPTHTTVDVTEQGVGPGDWYDPTADRFITPAVGLDAPETVPNDGTNATITITTTARKSQSVTVQIADYTTTVSVAPDSDHIETVTTTQPAGTTITITAEAQTDIRGDVAEITVVNP